MTIQSNTHQHAQVQTLKSTHVGVSFHVSMPAGYKTIKEVGKTVAEAYKLSDARRVSGRCDIFATPELRQAGKIAAGLRITFKSRTACGLEDGHRLAANVHTDKLQDWFDNARTELDKFYLDTVVPSVVSRRDADRKVAEEIARDQHVTGGIGTLFQESLYPSESQLRERYGLRLTWHQLPDPEHDVRVGCSTAQAARQAEHSRANQERLAASAHRDVIGRVVESLEWYSDRLGQYDGGRKGSFRDEGFDILSELAGLLPGFNIYNDPAFDQITSKIVKDVATLDPDDLRGKGTASAERRSSAKRKVDGILKDVKNIKSSDDILADVLGE